MNNDHAAGAVAMRMRVFFGGTAVRGPARMADAIGAVERTQPNRFFEVAQLAFSAADLEFVILVDDGDARRVVAAIFELPQTIDDQRHYLFVSDVTNNSTHKLIGMKM